MAHRLIPVLAGLACCVAGAPVFAQPFLADPTRPPAALSQETPEEAAAVPILQSVVIPRKGRPVAVIGGQTVRVGEKFGESRLVRLSEREAVLEGPSGIERLPLTPDVEKTDIVTKNMNKTPLPRRAQAGSKP